MASKAAACIGSQSTPDTENEPIGKIMRLTSRKLCFDMGWIITSGGAKGADTFFHEGLLDVDGRDVFEEGLFKLFMPKKGFNNHKNGILIQNEGLLKRARKIIVDTGIFGKNPPRFITAEGAEVKNLTEREIMVRNFYTRNVFQILQEQLEDPVKMVICWTPDGATKISEYEMGVTGGTGIAICVADLLKIPVFNLKRPDHLKRICDFVGIPTPEIKAAELVVAPTPQNSLF